MAKHDNEFYEKLSALVDGETAGADQSEIDQLLGQVCNDDSSLKAWQAYHLARDVVQKDYHSALPADFCAGLSARLAGEETYSAAGADDKIENIAADDHATVLPFQRRAKAKTSADVGALARSNRRWKSVAALGMAASVALASVAALQLFNSQDTGSAAGGPEIARLAPGSSTVTPLALSGGVVPAVLTRGGTHWRDSGSREGHALKVEQQLNSYLTNHLEDAAMGKVSGMISHTRVVGYDTSELRSESF